MKNSPNLTSWLIAVIILSLTFSCTNTDTGNNTPKKTVEDGVEEKANDTNKSDEISTKDGEASNAGFDFPYFMKFDLSDWKKISEKEYGEGDSWGKVYRYQKEGQTLEFTDGRTSYGYNQNFKLYDNNNQLLKERDFYYAMNSMGETVIDYTSQPAQEYSRKNETQVDYKLWESSDKPLLATGDWTISKVKEKANHTNKSDEISTKGGEASNSGFDFPHFMKFDLNDWKKISEKEYGEGDSWGKEYRYQKEGQTLESLPMDSPLTATINSLNSTTKIINCSKKDFLVIPMAT